MFGPRLFPSQEHTPFKEIDHAWCIVIFQPLGMNQAHKKKKGLWGSKLTLLVTPNVATPLWAKCEGEAHTPKSGNLESFETPKNSKIKLKSQNTSHWGVLSVIGKVLKCRCLNWPRIGHLNICSQSYGQKKGRESTWQFDSRPLKV